MTDSFERGSGDGEQQAFSVGELLQLPLELLLLLRASAEQFAESVELGVADLNDLNTLPIFASDSDSDSKHSAPRTGSSTLVLDLWNRCEQYELTLLFDVSVEMESLEQLECLLKLDLDWDWDLDWASERGQPRSGALPEVGAMPVSVLTCSSSMPSPFSLACP
eukprot:CAMPEP_0116900536 /NCGR_PEP_ID=MMETSP0467-20121206/8776_1 /TAXON_ID=283647 /ORGANISM="Mesodinium pulex, Strain SPMC105" /LENGTH=163 /DNA_ID=CAMNT_0004573797 /DNA_START=731 /DNA_END=1223 /DNA_ORIENTATION=-